MDFFIHIYVKKHLINIKIVFSQLEIRLCSLKNSWSKFAFISHNDDAEKLLTFWWNEFSNK